MPPIDGNPRGFSHGRGKKRSLKLSITGIKQNTNLLADIFFSAKLREERGKENHESNLRFSALDN